MRRGTKAGEGRVSARRGDVGVLSAAPGLTGHAGGTALGERKQSGRYRLTVRHHRTEAKPGPPAPCPAARESHPSFAPERTLFFVVENVRDVACGAKGPDAVSARFLAPRGEQTVRGAGKAVLLSAAARCDPDTLPWWPKCSSQAHYAAAAPRLARISSGGMPGKTGGPRPWRRCCPVPPRPAQPAGKGWRVGKTAPRCGVPGMFHVEHSGGGRQRNVPHGTFFKAQRKKEGQNASAQRPRRHNI